ncbi:hypothetical protein BJX64DRAFT_284026 [Aspergillus heterothallicus]
MKTLAPGGNFHFHQGGPHPAEECTPEGLDKQPRTSCATTRACDPSTTSYRNNYTPPATSRVVSILAAGKEAQIATDNLGLRKWVWFTFTTVGFYVTTMMSLVSIWFRWGPSGEWGFLIGTSVAFRARKANEGVPLV